MEENGQHKNGKKPEKEKEHAGEFPKPEFSGFITGLYTQTLLTMGLVEDPNSGEKKANLKEAQFLIDTIGMIETKTLGNLTDQEASYLKGVLNDLRIRYVEATRKKDVDAN